MFLRVKSEQTAIQSIMETIPTTLTTYANSSYCNKQLLTTTVEFTSHGLHAVDDLSLRYLQPIVNKRYNVPTPINCSRFKEGYYKNAYRSTWTSTKGTGMSISLIHHHRLVDKPALAQKLYQCDGLLYY